MILKCIQNRCEINKLSFQANLVQNKCTFSLIFQTLQKLVKHFTIQYQNEHVVQWNTVTISFSGPVLDYKSGCQSQRVHDDVHPKLSEGN